METPKFHGVQVLYLGNKNAIVDKIDGSYISIIEDNGSPHTLVYPSAFFKTETTKQFLETNSKNLRKQLRKDTEGKICQRCGAYSISLQKVNDTLICKECIEKEKRDFAICSRCQKKVVRNDGGKDCLGRFICSKCNNKFKRINLMIPGIYPILTVINRTPTHCKNASHCIESVRTKVLFLNGTTYARVPHEIDLLFCNDCKAYMCFSRDFELYNRRFGKLLLEVRFKNEYSDYLTQYRHIDRHYEPDTLLSRWGYIAQEGKQTDSERRTILSTIMDYDKYKKPEIISLLNYFLDDRGYRCPHAAPLWREDLEFVHQYDVNEPFIDLTEYSAEE